MLSLVGEIGKLRFLNCSSLAVWALLACCLPLIFRALGHPFHDGDALCQRAQESHFSALVV